MSESSGITTVRSPAVSSTQAGSLEAGLAGSYHFELGEVLHEAWVKTKGAKGTFVLALVLYMVVFIAADAVLSFAGLRSVMGGRGEIRLLVLVGLVDPAGRGYSHGCWVLDHGNSPGWRHGNSSHHYF